MNHPSRENVFLLSDDDGLPTALIRNRMVYALKELHDEQIAELFNGGLLPLVPAALAKKEV